MKIGKAVYLLNRLPLMSNTASDHDNHVAVQLGIEALKRIQSRRSFGWEIPLIPGETKE